MAKKKNMTALYEAMSRSRHKADCSGFNAPGWIGRTSPQAPTTVEPAPLAQAASSSAPYGPRLTLTGPGLVLILVCVLAAIVAGIVAGKMMFSKGGAANEAGNAAGQQAEQNPPAEVKPPVAANELPIRKPGKYYLVIQAMGGTSEQDKQDAVKIVEWLAKDKNEPAEVQKMQVGPNKMFWCVWSLHPMDSYSSAEATTYAEKIETYGKEYKSKFGKYWFSQHKQGKTLDPYYILFKGPPPRP